MPRQQQSEAQKETIGRVMHEYKHGELKTGPKGPKVKSRKQAVAIALSEAGASKQQSAAENRRNLKRSKAKERRGETAEAGTEGRKRTGDGRDGTTKAALYAEAKKRDIPGRSKMSKSQLEHALHR